MIVILTAHERQLATVVAERRDRYNGRMYGKVPEGLNRRAVDIDGACAEIAVAKRTNEYWHGSWDVPYGLPDVGRNIQVKSTRRADGCLILRPVDADDQYHFLVVVIDGFHFNIVGYIKGSEGKQDQFLRNPNEHTPAYFIPQTRLVEPELWFLSP